MEDYKIEGLFYRDPYMDDNAYQYYRELDFKVAKNQIIQFHYTLINLSTMIKTEYTTPIIIENQTISTTINY